MKKNHVRNMACARPKATHCIGPELSLVILPCTGVVPMRLQRSSRLLVVFDDTMSFVIEMDILSHAHQQ